MLGGASSLDRELGLPEVYAVTAGATLSSGFFLLPGLAATEAGSGIVLAYLLAPLLLMPAMLCLVELMTAMPRAGGLYYFLDRSMGPLVGTVGGLGTWIVLVLKIAFVLVGMGAYLGVFFPELPVVPVAVALAVATGALNLAGAKIGGQVQVALVAVILALLLLFPIGGVPSIEAGRLTGMLDSGTTGLLATTGLVYVSYAGLSKVAGIAEEVEDPERTLPRGMFLGVGTAVIVHLIGAVVLVGVLPMGQLEGNLRSVATGGEAVFGQVGMIVMAVAALLGFAAVTNAGTMSGSRYPLAMSRDDILPQRFRKLNDRGIPTVSVLFTVMAIVAVIVLLDPMKIAKLAGAFQLLMFALVCGAVVVMRESDILEYDPGFRAPGYPWLPIIGIFAPAVLVLEMGLWTSLFSVGLVFAGVVWYWRFVSTSTARTGAVLHVFERLGERRFEGLEHELQGLLHRRDATGVDPYRHVVGRAQVLELEGRTTLQDALDRSSERLGDVLPVGPDRLTETFMEETELGLTPISHGLALPHVRLSEVTVHHLLIVRVRQGIEFAGDRVMRVPVEAGRADGSDEVYGLLVLVSPTEHPEEHLQMLARLAGHVRTENFLEEFLDAAGEPEIKRLLLRGERIEVLRLSSAGPTAELCGRALEETSLPAGVIVTLVRRNGEALVPSGDTRLEEGDVVTLVGSQEGMDRLRQWLETG